MHILYCWSDRPILCGHVIEFDCSRSFRFYKHFDVSEKNMGCLAHQKYIFATFPLLANANKIYKYKIEWFSETETLLLLTLWQRPQEHFNRHPPLWHPYTLTFYVIPYTLKTLESYFPGIIEHIRVCGPRSGFSVVIRFATKSVLQNIHAFLVFIHTPPLSNKREWGSFTRRVVLHRWIITLLTFLCMPEKTTTLDTITEFKRVSDRLYVICPIFRRPEFHF